ncbi:HMG box transcription factor BBX [Lampetra planeri]
MGKANLASTDALTHTGGLSLLLLAGENALNGSPPCEIPSTQTHQSHRSAAAEERGISALFQLAEMCSDRLSTDAPDWRPPPPPPPRAAASAALACRQSSPRPPRPPPLPPGKARRRRRKRRQRLGRDGLRPAGGGDLGERRAAAHDSNVDVTIDSVVKGDDDDDDEEEVVGERLPRQQLPPLLLPPPPCPPKAAAAAEAGAGGAEEEQEEQEEEETHGGKRRGGESGRVRLMAVGRCQKVELDTDVVADVQHGFVNIRKVKMETKMDESRQEQAAAEPPGLVAAGNAAAKMETLDDGHVTAKAKHITSADGVGGFAQRALQRGCPPTGASHDAPGLGGGGVDGGGGGASDGEHSGSRKSKRTCKGALYKTLVLEGMLTTLRANLDRGKKGLRSLGEEPHRSREEERVSPVSPISPRRLKRTRSKDCDKPRLGSLRKELEEKLSRLPTSLPPSKKPLARSPADRGGPSSKKQPFHKIVSKYKHKRDSGPTCRPSASGPPPSPPSCSFGDPSTPGPSGGPCPRAPHGETRVAAPAAVVPRPAVSRKAGAAPARRCPGSLPTEGSLTGSQKRKARKSRITHLVRSADGQLSPTSDKSRPSAACPSDHGATSEGSASVPGTPSDASAAGSLSVPGTPSDASLGSLSSFFSLAALAEVAAMETTSRPQPTNRTRESQAKEISQSPLYISCMD